MVLVPDAASAKAWTNVTANVAVCVRVDLKNGEIYRWTDHDRALTLPGVEFSGLLANAAGTYTPAGGLTSANVRRERGLRATTTEISGVIEASEADGVTLHYLRAGRIRDATVHRWEVDWRFPWKQPARYDQFLVRDVDYDEYSWTASLATYRRDLARQVGDVHSRGCRNEWGDSICNEQGYTDRDRTSHTQTGTYGFIRGTGGAPNQVTGIADTTPYQDNDTIHTTGFPNDENNDVWHVISRTSTSIFIEPNDRGVSAPISPGARVTRVGRANGSVATVTDRRRIRIAYAGGLQTLVPEIMGADWFQFGYLQMGVLGSDPNNNLRVPILTSSEIGGASPNLFVDVELTEGLPFTVQVGHRAELIPGCARTFSVCRNKFANTRQFRGAPHIPGADRAQRSGDAS